MIRKIIKIDEEKCNGCGACADACHEGAIEIVNGKASLKREDYCDGLGDCLPACPTDAISFEEREAAAYNEKAVFAAKETAKKNRNETKVSCGFSGPLTKSLEYEICENKNYCQQKIESRLNQWPCQIKLVAPVAPYFKNADILVAADCTAYAYASIHADFMKGKITLIGCPKLDAVDYSEKLTAIFQMNDIKSVTVLRMEVPCCGGMEKAVKKAIANSGKNIDLKVKVVSIGGEIIC